MSGAWGLSWKAIASTETVSARDNTASNPRIDRGVPVYLVNGTLLAANYEALWGPQDGEGSAVGVSGMLNVTERGNLLAGTEKPDNDVLVWTGTMDDGSAGFDDAGPLGAAMPLAGHAAAAGSHPFTAVQRPSTELHHFYAMSDIITAVPEPSTNDALIVVAMLGLALFREKISGT